MTLDFLIKVCLSRAYDSGERNRKTWAPTQQIFNEAFILHKLKIEHQVI